MSKIVDVKWDVLLEDDDWADDGKSWAAVTTDTQARPTKSLARTLVVLCLLVVVGLWLWRGGPFAPTQAEVSVAAAVSSEARIPAETILTEVTSSPGIQPVDFEKSEVLPAAQVEIEQSHFLGQQAMVDVRVTDAALPLSWREVRFYEQSVAGWQRIAPVSAFWGDEQTLDSEYFRFRYRRGDGLAVQQAAVALDSHYSDLRRAFGLPAASATDKIRVEVEIGHGFSDRSQGRMQLSSPRLLAIPDGLTDRDVLVQSALFVLTEWAISEVQQRHTIYWVGQMREPMRNGLRIWSHRQSSAPLARWQGGLAQTAFATDGDGGEILAEMCQFLSVWGADTPEAGLGIPCEGMGGRLDKADWPAARLDQLPTPFDDYAGGNPDVQIDLPGSSLVLASLLDYATERYGRGRIPVLLGSPVGAGSWDALIPAVFDLSAAEFEAGWREWLGGAYGL